MKTILFIIISALLFINIYAGSDSDGQYFVASFAPYNSQEDLSTFQVELVYIPIEKRNAMVDTQWYSMKYNEIVHERMNVDLESNYMIQTFSYAEIIDDSYTTTSGPVVIPDPRIIIKSNTPIKVIARIFNRITGKGDSYDLVSTNFVSNEYEVNLPKSNKDGFQLIHILPSDSSPSIVQYIHFQDGVQVDTGTLLLHNTLGAFQNAISVPFDGTSHNYYFKGDNNFYITAAVTNVDINYYATGNSNQFGNEISEYVAYQAVPLSPYDCKHLYNDPTDIRMTTIQNSVSVFIGGGATNCGNTFPIYTLNDNRNQRSNGFGPDDSFAFPGNQGLVVDLNTIVETTSFGSQATHDLTPWTRLGTIRDPRTKLPNGLFIHYVPDSTAFVSGDTRFYSFNDGDMIEVYGDNSVNINEFLIDGKATTRANDVTVTPIKLFKSTFNAFTMIIPTAGIHTFSSRGKYVVFVMGKNIPTKPFLYGYTASYNTSKLTSYWAYDLTTVPSINPTSTTSNSAVDSDGTEFVFAFIDDDNQHGVALKTSVIVIPIFKDSVCTFQYTLNSNDSLFSLQKVAFYGKTNEFFLNFNELILTTSYNYIGISDVLVKDFRIYVTCTEEVKLIGKIIEPYHAWGETFLIPSTKNAGNRYILDMVSSTDWTRGSVTLLPFTQQKSLNVNIVGYLNDKLFSNQTIEYDTTFGQNQNYIAVSPTGISGDDSNVTLVISASSPIMIAYATSYASTSNLNDNSCGRTCLLNYVTSFILPSNSKKCHHTSPVPDQRMMTNNFTTRLYVSPPSINSSCNEVLSINIYDTNNHDNEIISSTQPNTVDLTKRIDVASSTYDGQMPIYRLGSILQGDYDSWTAYGHFMHYVPSVSEWISGKSQFYTLTKDCYLEIYANLNDINSDNLITIDGKRLPYFFKYDMNPLKYFDTTFTHIVVSVSGYGLHTIDNIMGNYVLYVVCKNVEGPYNAVGYVTGFNRPKNDMN